MKQDKWLIRPLLLAIAYLLGSETLHVVVRILDIDCLFCYTVGNFLELCVPDTTQHSILHA